MKERKPLTPADLEQRVLMLQAQMAAMEALCLSLAQALPDPALLLDHWRTKRTRSDVLSVELDAMYHSLGEAPAVEESEMVRDSFHALDRLLTQLLPPRP